MVWSSSQGEPNVPQRAVRHHWRSSDGFIISTMCLALFTDELLFAFMVPLLPTILEDRIGLAASSTQRYTSIFLAEGAFVSVVSSPFIGSIADATSSKKLLLLILLVLALVSVVCLSLTTTLSWLFIGRFFQSIASNALWIVGMVTMTENIGSEHMGKIAGLSSTMTAVGTTTGPVLAGILFGLGGYWLAWAGAIGFLVVDIIMRLLMVERQHTSENEERDPLLNDSSESPSTPNGIDSPEASPVEIQGWRFYLCLFRQSRFAAGIFGYYVSALLIACFESTLAVHVRDAFGWGVLPVGLLMTSIQGPGMVLAPFVGWLRDRIGSRTPTTIGFIALIPFLFLLGIPGDDRFPWANEGSRGKVIYAVSMAMLGCLMCMLGGVGTMEATETIDLLETDNPGIFGPNGGYSRAIAITGMSFMAGLMTGPLLAGLLVEQLGYFELQCVLGKSSPCLLPDVY
ncbi:hypothetical protein N7466_007329 [Penicillium verhagenii]|uniref:uncharacterized protein n=1 Tax=Penicillium verhagenii TaxID=1562060 RepID=UPI0025458C3C|nr:uncharacterized protein N7466_007329 [Penicillium verhagenii]KAJ5928373.1 hypothetical protein N7466_007329 [Penicillium verhagenii]